MTDWRPIETAPRTYVSAMPEDPWISRCLVARQQPWGWEMWTAQCDSGMWISPNGDGSWADCAEPTHWQPMPKPPSD